MQHLVMATFVQGIRLGELKSFENAPLWKDNALVNEVCWKVSNEEIKSKEKSKATQLFCKSASQASKRLQNLAYALKGCERVVK